MIVQKGDTLVIGMAIPMTIAECNQLSNDIKVAMPGINKVVIIDQCLSIGVYRPENKNEE